MASLIGPSTAREGAFVNYDARQSSDPDGDRISYVWITGDGRTFPDPNGQMGWQYANNGTYTASVIVTDEHGAVDTASSTVAISNVAPLIERIEPAAHQAIGDHGRLKLWVADSGWTDTHFITVRWGDGASDSFSASQIVYMAAVDSATHAYSSAGEYWIAVTVRDDDGGKDSTTAPSPVVVFDSHERKTIAGYETRDIGTLGGNSALPIDFNDRGEIVGSSLTAEGPTHAFLWDGGMMRDLGTLGYLQSEAQRINNAGLIAGVVWSESGEEYPRLSLAATWSDGIGTLLNGPLRAVVAQSMNNAGDVLFSAVGHESSKNLLWHDGAWRDLGYYSQKEPNAADMNNDGQMVFRQGFHARLWEDDSVHNLGVLSWRCAGDPECGWAFAMDINETGQIVGTSSDTGKLNRFVVWKNGTIQPLALVPSTSSVYWQQHAYINDRGQIAVSSGGQAFFWSDGNRQTLVAPGGHLEVTGLSEDGNVVGHFMSAPKEQHVFLWSKSRGFVDLGTGPHGFSAAWAVGINAQGDVLGYAGICTPSYGDACFRPEHVRAIVWHPASP